MKNLRMIQIFSNRNILFVSQVQLRKIALYTKIKKQAFIYFKLTV